jgi:hypothetical protein
VRCWLTCHLLSSAAPNPPPAPPPPQQALCTLPYQFAPRLQQLVHRNLNFINPANRVRHAGQDALQAMVRPRAGRMLREARTAAAGTVARKSRMLQLELRRPDLPPVHACAQAPRPGTRQPPAAALGASRPCRSHQASRGGLPATHRGGLPATLLSLRSRLRKGSCLKWWRSSGALGAWMPTHRRASGKRACGAVVAAGWAGCVCLLLPADAARKQKRRGAFGTGCVWPASCRTEASDASLWGYCRPRALATCPHGGGLG